MQPPSYPPRKIAEVLEVMSDLKIKYESEWHTAARPSEAFLSWEISRLKGIELIGDDQHKQKNEWSSRV